MVIILHEKIPKLNSFKFIQSLAYKNICTINNYNVILYTNQLQLNNNYSNTKLLITSFKNTLNYCLSSITINTHGTYLNIFFVCFVHLILLRFINASENLVASIMSVGEGWHNYHHVFPWDYKTAELGNYHFNYTTAFIHLFAKIGWAYDLKTTSTELVRKRASRTGLVDSGGDPVPLSWGWDDKDCPQSDRMEATIVNRKHG